MQTDNEVSRAYAHNYPPGAVTTNSLPLVANPDSRGPRTYYVAQAQIQRGKNSLNQIEMGFP